MSKLVRVVRNVAANAKRYYKDTYMSLTSLPNADPSDDEAVPFLLERRIASAAC